MKQDLNTKAAEIMGFILVGEGYGKDGEGLGWVNKETGFSVWPNPWSPTTDRNQTVMVLKRMAEFGLEDLSVKRAARHAELEGAAYISCYGYGPECCAEDDWDGLYLWLVLDPAIIIQACVDVWEAHQKKEIETND